MTGANHDLHENKFYMLWTSILTYHFPIAFEYGVAPQALVTGTGEFLVVKVARNDESVVLVVDLEKPAEDHDAGRARVKEELAEYIEERFDEAQFDTIYAMGSIGHSWVVYKMDRSGPQDLELVLTWSSNVKSAVSHDALQDIAKMIDVMTGTTR